MVVNDEALQGEGTEYKLALEDTAMELAELVLRVYEREQSKKGDVGNGK